MTTTTETLERIATTPEYRELRWNHGGDPIGDIIYDSAGQNMYDGALCDLAERLHAVIQDRTGAHDGASRLDRHRAAAALLAMLPDWAQERGAA